MSLSLSINKLWFLLYHLYTVPSWLAKQSPVDQRYRFVQKPWYLYQFSMLFSPDLVLTHRGFGWEDAPSIFIDRSTNHNCVPKVTGDPFDKQFLIITEDYFYFKRTSLIFLHFTMCTSAICILSTVYSWEQYWCLLGWSSY